MFWYLFNTNIFVIFALFWPKCGSFDNQTVQCHISLKLIQGFLSCKVREYRHGDSNRLYFANFHSKRAVNRCQNAWNTVFVLLTPCSGIMNIAVKINTV
jgi:hypothetical protein